VQPVDVSGQNHSHTQDIYSTQFVAYFSLNSRRPYIALNRFIFSYAYRISRSAVFSGCSIPAMEQAKVQVYSIFFLLHIYQLNDQCVHAASRCISGFANEIIRAFLGAKSGMHLRKAFTTAPLRPG
jgi:hypothetical protein